MKTEKGSKKDWEAFGCLITVCIGVYLVFVSASWVIKIVDESGWWSRNHDTPTFFDGNWIIGEYRECEMLTDSMSGDGFTRNAVEAAKLPQLYCGLNAVAHQSDMASPHVLPVKYHGRIKRPAKWSVEWRCQRNQESLTCWALN